MPNHWLVKSEPYKYSFDALLKVFVDDVGVDGFFTDHTDLAVAYLRRREKR